MSIDKDTIIRMAREIGMPVSDTFGPMVGACPVGDLLERFAQAAYRQGLEDAAKVCDVTIPGDEYATAIINSYADAIRELMKEPNHG